MNHDFVYSLRARLAERPTGAAALERFAPSHTRDLRFQPPPTDARNACVLVLLYPRGGELYLPLVVRPGRLRHHGGQVALPGGAHEPGESLSDTALRELEEELGVPKAGVELMGRLSPFFVPVSGFQVHPWVGWTPDTPSFRTDPAEVEELLETPAVPILDLSTFGREWREIRGEQSEVPYFAVGQHKVWGATCIVLGELALVWDRMTG
jgi:8-oxo-dGTP pyrophosphatase MutT (NUDIX family)